MSFIVQYDFSEFNKLSSKLIDKVSNVLSDKEFQNEIAQMVKNDIVGQTRSGISVVTGRPFKPLKEGWIKIRQKIIASIGARPFVSASRSNLSLSGELLDSLDYNIEKTGLAFRAKFKFVGTHKPYRYLGSRGKMITKGGRISNDELAKILDRDRPFIGVRPKLQQIIISHIVDRIRLEISKSNMRG